MSFGDALTTAATVAAGLRTYLQAEVRRAGYEQGGSIPAEMTFRQWCEDLGARGMKVDQRPFRLTDRPALVPIYDAIPTTRDEAAGRWLIVQKATQLGLTVWEVLADIYMALKWGPVNIGLFLPDQAIASFKSDRRFMPLVRSVPELHRHLTYRPEMDGSETKVGEGNILTRAVGLSLLMFLWTSGKASTESRPMDIVSLDEVQNMTLTQIEKVLARLGDSELGFIMMLSTANMPDLDINYWYQQGTQEVWHTRCDACGALSDLSDPAGILPERSIGFHTQAKPIAPAPVPGRAARLEPPLDEFVWTCPVCGTYVPDPQHGEYVCANPKADPRMRSFLLPRTISPRMTARTMMTAWNRASGGDLRKNLYNRTLARPYIDPNQMPVSLAHCLAAAEEGKRRGVQWLAAAEQTVMGIDQMGSFNVAIIKARLSTGHQAVIHAEAIYDIDPFARCDELMQTYGVTVCVLEQLPNVNDARKFANKFRGRVFLASYTDMRDDMMQWGDALKLSSSDRRTAQEDRTRYTVTIDQYKAMQAALYRVRDKACLFPDPAGREQEVMSEQGVRGMSPILDMVFHHLTKVALVVEENPETFKKRPAVRKVGIDPHFAFANMLCDIAWARNHGNAVMILPDEVKDGPEPQTDRGRRALEQMPGLPKEVAAMMDDIPPGTCGRCQSFKGGQCVARQLIVGPRDPQCVLFAAKRS